MTADILILLRRLMISVAVCSMLATPAAAQDDLLAASVTATDAHDFATARADLATVLHRNPGSYEANWRMALVLIEVAKQIPDHIKSPARDSMYVLAERYARAAVSVNPNDAQGHFALADAIGRASLSRSPREQVRRATEVRNEALRAVQLDPHHDGAWHILGRWNAEVERLPAIERLFAKAFLGASVFNSASWDEAERDLRLAVQYAPTRIVHHFDLAEVLVWRQKWAQAKAQLDVVASLPAVDVSDTSYQRQGRALRIKVMEKLDR